MSDFRFRALISVVFQPLCPACSLFLFRRINDDDDDTLCLKKGATFIFANVDRF